MPKKNKRIDPLPQGKIIPLKMDFLFTQILGDYVYHHTLEQLLSDVLSIKKDILENKIEYINRDLKITNKRKMLNKVDLLIKHEIFKKPKKDEYINVELNSQLPMLNRNKVYTNLIGANTLQVGNNKYKNIASIVQVNFNFFDVLDKDAERLVAIYQMRDQDGKVAYGWDDKIYNIFVNLSKDPCYNLINEQERRVANWCLLMDTDDEEVFLRKAIEIMGEEEETKLFDRVKELSADEDNIALYTEYSNQEMLLNTIKDDAKEIKAQAYKDIAKAKKMTAKAEADIAKASKIFTENEKMIAENEKIAAENEKIAAENKKLKEEKENQSKEIAKNMLANNLSKDLIANVTGLSLEEINSLEQ